MTCVSNFTVLKPFAEVSIVERLNEHSTVKQYKYFKVLIQEFHIKLDIGFINALVNFFEAGEISDALEVRIFLKSWNFAMILHNITGYTKKILALFFPFSQPTITQLDVINIKLFYLIWIRSYHIWKFLKFQHLVFNPLQLLFCKECIWKN